jgi:hypothetical protein
MDRGIKNIIKEHSQLYVRIQKLDNFIYNEDTSHINKADFANLCIQLAAMRQYEKCLIARLNNAGVIFGNGLYHECVAAVNTEEDAEESKEKDEQ